jgi:hypothetical protein
MALLACPAVSSSLRQKVVAQNCWTSQHCHPSDHGEPVMDYTYLDIAKMIDHSLLNPIMTVEELEAGCQLALEYDVASVCIMPFLTS